MFVSIQRNWPFHTSFSKTAAGQVDLHRDCATPERTHWLKQFWGKTLHGM